ncbi:uncharacterized protein LOC135497714 [Lineus longissimus]|uniref:uncharacterized protein LOC135497714 n=1 Tax=Lineus longissimus TaxID=88925 RepID=UPI00315C82C6
MACSRLHAALEAALNVSKRLASKEKDGISSSRESKRGDLAKLVRLPKIELPKFSGNVIEWQSFWDKFDALIHSSGKPPIGKCNYLDGLLVGEANATIAGLSVTADHYNDARQLLEDRFGRKEKIAFAHHHIQVLLKMSSRSHTSGGKVSQLSKLYGGPVACAQFRCFGYKR